MRFKKIIFILIIFFLGIDNKIIIAKKDLKKLNKVIKEKNLANSYCAFSHSMCKDGWNWVNYSDMENRLKVDFLRAKKTKFALV